MLTQIPDNYWDIKPGDIVTFGTGTSEWKVNSIERPMVCGWYKLHLECIAHPLRESMTGWHHILNEEFSPVWKLR